MNIMLTKLLDKFIVNSLELLQLQPVLSSVNNKPFVNKSNLMLLLISIAFFISGINTSSIFLFQNSSSVWLLILSRQ